MQYLGYAGNIYDTDNQALTLDCLYRHDYRSSNIWLKSSDNEAQGRDYAILDLCAKVGFGFIVTSTNLETLAHASNSNRIMETVHSYMESGERERSYNR